MDKNIKTMCCSYLDSNLRPISIYIESEQSFPCPCGKFFSVKLWNMCADIL